MAKPFRQVRIPADERPGFGRPSVYDPSYCQRAIDYMGKGYSLTAFAAEIGVSRESVYRWITERSDFCDAMKKAKDARQRALETKLLETTVGVGVTAAIFALKNAAPDEWQDRYNTTTDINVKVQRLPDDELMRIAASGRAPLTIEHDAIEPIPPASQRTTDRKSD